MAATMRDVLDLLYTGLALLGLALFGWAFFRAGRRLVPRDVTGEDEELDPVERAMRDASASGFDMQ